MQLHPGHAIFEGRKAAPPDSNPKPPPRPMPMPEPCAVPLPLLLPDPCPVPLAQAALLDLHLPYISPISPLYFPISPRPRCSTPSSSPSWTGPSSSGWRSPSASTLTPTPTPTLGLALALPLPLPLTQVAFRLGYDPALRLQLDSAVAAQHAAWALSS